MLKEGIFIFECGYCGEETLLHFKECRKCGRPNKFYQERAQPSSGGETGESVVTAKQEEETAPEGGTGGSIEAKQAEDVVPEKPLVKGEAWQCFNCDAMNREDTGFECASCNVDRRIFDERSGGGLM